MLQFPPAWEAQPGSILSIIPAHPARRAVGWHARTSQRVQLPGLPQSSLSLGSLQVGWGRTLAPSPPTSQGCRLVLNMSGRFPRKPFSLDHLHQGALREFHPRGRTCRKRPRGPAGDMHSLPLSWAPSSACTGGSDRVRAARIWSRAVHLSKALDRSGEAGPAPAPRTRRALCSRY